MRHSTAKVSAIALTGCLIAATALALGAALPVSAAAKRERIEPIKACSFAPATWAREDRLPPVVRATPSFHAPIVGRMTHERLPADDGQRGVDVTVTAISGDWVRIDPVAAQPDRGIAAVPAGWIEVHDIYFVMQTAVGFARPDAKSRRVYATDDWIYRKAIIGIRDCKDGWLKLKIYADPEEGDEEDYKPSFATAWFRGFCGNQETTCDGVTGD